MMHERDLPHEREPQTRAALGAGGVAPVKPLPDLFLLGLGDAGAIVLYGDHGAAVFPTERDADVSAFAPVFVRVLHQIEHRPREERGVVRGRNAGLNIGLERHAALVRGDELVAAGVYKAGEIAHAQRVFFRALLDAREREQLLDERIHLVALLLDDVDGGEKVLLRFRLAPGAVALGEDHRHGRAQLVRRVGGELLFGEERRFQPREHTVERAGEPPHLARAAPEIKPGGEIVAVGNAARGFGDALEREE